MSVFIGLKWKVMLWLTHSPQMLDCATVPHLRGWTWSEVAVKKDKCPIQHLRRTLLDLWLIQNSKERNLWPMSDSEHHKAYQTTCLKRVAQHKIGETWFWKHASISPHDVGQLEQWVELAACLPLLPRACSRPPTFPNHLIPPFPAVHLWDCNRCFSVAPFKIQKYQKLAFFL